MKKFIYLFILFFSLLTSHSIAKDTIMILKLKYGEVQIELYPEKAPNHVKRFKELANQGKYDNVVFHRVIDGFMAQTGDVKFGNTSSPDFNLSLAGTGGSTRMQPKSPLAQTSRRNRHQYIGQSADKTHTKRPHFQ